MKKRDGTMTTDLAKIYEEIHAACSRVWDYFRNGEPDPAHIMTYVERSMKPMVPMNAQRHTRMTVRNRIRNEVKARRLDAWRRSELALINIRRCLTASLSSTT